MGLTQQALAQEAGVAPATLAEFERGGRRPQPRTLDSLCSALEAAGVAFVADGVRPASGAAPDPVTGRELAAILRRLQGAEGRLRKLGVARLSVFGSLARGESTATSDIDLLFEPDPARDLDLLDHAGIVVAIEALLGRGIDLARRDKLKPAVAEAAREEELRVF